MFYCFKARDSDKKPSGNLLLDQYYNLIRAEVLEYLSSQGSSNNPQAVNLGNETEREPENESLTKSESGYVSLAEVEFSNVNLSGALKM